MSKSLIGSIILNAFLIVLFIYLGLGPWELLKKMFTPTGQICWKYVIVNLLIISALILYAIINISFSIQSVRSAETTREAKTRNKQVERPYIDIKGEKIKFSKWTEKEKIDDPEITKSCDKIILYFSIRNCSAIPASNVDISAQSYIIDEKNVANLTQKDMKHSYEHNLHLVTASVAGMQPFILALSKKAVNYFKEGIIKVKLIVKITYNGVNDRNKYWSEKAMIYSPIFENFAHEIYSKGI